MRRDATKGLPSAIGFSVIVTLAMNSLDMLYHLATETAVHLGYVAVKATIIFMTVFLIAHLIGRGKAPGIVTAILGPLMFFVYYRFATPTLDRNFFVLDENVLYIAIHAAALGITYWLAHRGVSLRGARLPSIALLAGLSSLALFIMYLQGSMKLAGAMDEMTVGAISFGGAMSALAIATGVSYIAAWWLEARR